VADNTRPDRPDGFTVSKRALRWLGGILVALLIAGGAFALGHGNVFGPSPPANLAVHSRPTSTTTPSAAPTTAAIAKSTTTIASTTSTPAPTSTTSTATSTTTSTTTVPKVTPSQLLERFYADLNARKFSTAWALQDRHFQAILGGFASWEAGYASTASDNLTIVGVSGNEVDISLVATQDDGSTKDYQGVYYVHASLITGADVAETASVPGPWCSVSVDPSYDGWGDIEVNVTSNQANDPISIRTSESGGTDTLTGSTDAYGDAAATYPAVDAWTAGYTVDVTVTAGGATCDTTFTP